MSYAVVYYSLYVFSFIFTNFLIFKYHWKKIAASLYIKLMVETYKDLIFSFLPVESR